MIRMPTSRALVYAAGVLSIAAACIPLPPPPQPAPHPTSVPTSVPTVRPTAVPARPFQASSGRAVVRVDLTGFEVAAGLDVYTIGTLCWVDPGPWPRPAVTTPCLQLAVRGSSPVPCERKPCLGAAALEVRFSANLKRDAAPGMLESQMCGEGTRPGSWIPLGPSPVFDVAVDWSPGSVRVSTPAGSWVATQGAAAPGFGAVVFGVPDHGIGWSYMQQWALQRHGGTASLVSWAGTPGAIGTCP